MATCGDLRMQISRDGLLSKEIGFQGNSWVHSWPAGSNSIAPSRTASS